MNLCIFKSLQLLVGYKQQDKIGKLNSWKSQLLHFIMAIYIYSVHCSKLKLWQLCLFETCLLQDTFPEGFRKTQSPINKSHKDGPKASSGHRVFPRYREMFYIPASGSVPSRNELLFVISEKSRVVQ